MNRCQLCEGPELELYRLCAGCARATLNRLRDMPRLYKALAMLLPPAARPPRLDSGGGSPAVEAPMPIPEALLDMRGPGGIVGVLEDWHAALAADRGWGVPVVRGSVEARLKRAVSGLASSVEWIAASWPAAGDFAREMRDLEHGVLSMLSPPVRDERNRMGKCPHKDNGVLCGAQLWLRPREEIVRCDWCQAIYPSTTWRRLKAEQDKVWRAVEAGEIEESAIRV